MNSPKYRETEGIKDIGSQFWNQGRTQEIQDRYVHVAIPKIENTSLKSNSEK